MWELFRPDALDWLGYLPQIILHSDPRPVKEQVRERYAHGGGWHPFEGFVFSPEKLTIKYPGDPAYKALARTEVNEETVIVYPHAWVLVLQKDGSYEISRMD